MNPATAQLLPRQIQYLTSAAATAGDAEDGGDVAAAAAAASLLRLSPALWNVAGTSGGSSSHEDAVSPSAAAAAAAAASSNNLHKLTLRIQSLLAASSSSSCRSGLQLALVLVDALPWNMIVGYAGEWIQRALVLLQQPAALADAIALLNVLLGSEARLQPEFWRGVGAPNAIKYGLALVDAAEQATSLTDKKTTLAALADQVAQHPSTFRPHAPRLHKLCTRLLFAQRACLDEAAVLLARLPLTGKGAEAQAQLWAASLQLLIAEARRAWAACSSSYAPMSRGHAQAGVTALSYAMPDLPVNDNLEATHEGQRRLALLLGAPPSPGIIPLFLCEGTNAPVNLPVDDLVDFATEMLATLPSSPARRDTPVEVTLQAAQSALIPLAHLAAMTLVVSLPAVALCGRQPTILARLLGLVERGAPSIRCTAIQTINMLQLPLALDPASPLLVRCTRTCLAQLARLLRTPSSSDSVADAKGSTASSSSTGNKPHKRRRLYDADQVVFRPTRGFIDVTEDELAACKAAIACLAACYESLVTYLTTEMHDLAHTLALLLLGMLEIALKNPCDGLAACLLHAVASLVRSSRGSILGLLSVRAATLCANGLTSAHEDVRQEARGLQSSLSDAMHPKLPPKLALKLYVEHDQDDVGLGAADADEEGSALGGVELAERAGEREQAALSDVLLIDSDPRNSTTLSFGYGEPDGASNPTQFAELVAQDIPTPSGAATRAPSAMEGNAAAAAAAAVRNSGTYSPDPVKPSHRPNTPRIGSPSAVGASISPERSAQSATNAPTPHLLSPSPLSKGVIGGAAPQSEPRSQQQQQQQQHSTMSPPPSAPSPSAAVVPAAAEVSFRDAAFQGDGYNNDDDSDGSIPELDIRSSDEESDAEEGAEGV